MVTIISSTLRFTGNLYVAGTIFGRVPWVTKLTGFRGAIHIILFAVMGWQKTFTLAKRSKGCHLVTEEILSHIESGLNEIQV
jgi:hypothetical protein